jgi:hypothetical protein
MVSGQASLVENQQRFRRANQRLFGAVSPMVDGDRPVPFLCECADASCTAAVHLTLTQYRGVRSEDSRFVIVPGHATIDGEGVATDNERFSVVEKPGI